LASHSATASPTTFIHPLCTLAAAAAPRALSQVHPAGGLVPRLLLLVQRRYPLLYWCRSRKQFITPKALAAAQQKAERQQEQVGAAVLQGTGEAGVGVDIYIYEHDILWRAATCRTASPVCDGDIS
jgi:hypothetical protein